MVSLPTSTPREKKAFLALTIIVFTTALCRRLSRFFDDGFPGTWGDDFFYYLKIAMNIAIGKGSTFDGSILTNGYHPLWMGCLTAIVWAVGPRTALVVLGVLFAAVTALVFVLARALAARLIGSNGAASMLIGAYTAGFFYNIAKHGMEIILTVPALIYFMLRLVQRPALLASKKELVVTGALAALVVLSRIDSAMYIAFFGLGYLWFSGFEGLKRSDAVGRGLAFLIGFSPVFLYGLSNVVQTGHVLQVSAGAKQLSVPSLSRIRIFDFAISSRFIAYFFRDVPFLALWASLAATAFRGVFADRFLRFVIFGPLVSFIFCYYVLQGVMSDWPLWDWYLYPVICATPVTFAAVALAVPSLTSRLELFVRSSLESTAGVLSLAVLALLPFAWSLNTWRSPVYASPMWSFAKTLTEFSKTHPGRYAMGDRAGTVGYIFPHSLMQLEGLVEDRRFLENIKAQRDLASVLKEYDIDYYVSSKAPKVGTCYDTVEPFQAGPSSPKMRGHFCREPLLVHNGEDGTVSVVFGLKSAHD